LTEKQTTLLGDFPTTLNVLQDLDRGEVEPLAFKVLTTIEPMCQRTQIAGSIRRFRPLINDIDIVLEPKVMSQNVDTWLQIIKIIRHEFDAVTSKQGPKLATLYIPFASKKGQGHVQLDLYRASPETYGILLLIRTGSAQHNVYLCNLAINKGLCLEYSRGLIKNGNVIAGRTEEEVFAALGLPFVPPGNREVQEDL
jgi:DNA polymerase (family 10)